MTRPEAMRLAREMWGAWSAPQIAHYLGEQGVKVSRRTAWRWANGAEGGTSDDNRLRVARARSARVFKRITALRDRSLSFDDIAAVLSVDQGREITGDQVRYSVKSGRVSSELYRALFDEQDKFVTGALRTAGPVVESRPESTRGEPTAGGCDARLSTPTPWSDS